MAANEWVFTQLRDSGRQLKLAGASAPHGRPRQRPVVSDGIKLRKQKYFYPGNSIPTTHIFGFEHDDYELEGRFNDQWLGVNGTKQAITNWQQLVADQIEVNITWGGILGVKGLVTAFLPGREAETQCSYKITVEIHESPFTNQGAIGAIPTPTTPLALAQLFDDDIKVVNVPSFSNSGALLPDFVDALDDLVSTLNIASATQLNIAGEIAAFKEGTAEQLERLQAGIAQSRTATNALRDTILGTENNDVLLSRDADSDTQWFAARGSVDVALTEMLSILEDMDREAELARLGRVLRIYTAIANDTWESISTKAYGGPDGAGAIRDANGILYGALPIAGRTYQVPQRQ